MANIFAHITGLNDLGKQTLINSFYKSDFYIQDLDDFTSKIISDKNMNYMWETYEDLQTKINSQQKIKLLERKMNLYWKSKMDEYINNIFDKIKKKIILIGYSTYFKNHKIGINIKTNIKFFQKLNLLTHAKNIVQENLDKYRNDIINGEFPLDYLNLSYIIKKRDTLMNYYQKIGYNIDSINNIINTIHIASKNIAPTSLYFASKENYIKKIPLVNNKIITYEDEWVSIISAFNNKNIVKGYLHNKPFVKVDNINILKQPIYIYLITDTSEFVPIPSKNKIYKYQIAKPIIYSKKITINDTFTKLKEMNVKII